MIYLRVGSCDDADKHIDQDEIHDPEKHDEEHLAQQSANKLRHMIKLGKNTQKFCTLQKEYPCLGKAYSWVYLTVVVDKFLI